MRPSARLVLLLGFTFLGLPSTFLTAQDLQRAGDRMDGLIRPEEAPVVRAELISVPPTVDGFLDEEVWSDTPVLEGFVQRMPWDGDPVSETTRIRIVYDAHALYVGAWLLDSAPDQIVPGESIRDFDVAESDAVILILDTFRDRKNGFVFGTNPSGIEYDGQVANEGEGTQRSAAARTMQRGAGGGFNLNWDGSWEVATSRDEGGWYAEFRIPFSTLRYGSGGVQDWGINVSRKIRRHNEEAFWAPIPREFNLYRLSFAGTLQGIQPPSTRSATITPYVLGSASRDYAAGEEEFSYPSEFGGEVKLQVTQGLTLDATYNTDFAQVEVDDAQVNLTRFNLFFPEKRPFFLENAGFFSVGVAEAELFFSRRIGISDQGSPVPIQGGARLSGRVAGLNVGLLHIQTDSKVGIQEENAYSVARVAKELPSRSRIGAIFLNREGQGGSDFNRTYALDGQVGIGDALTFTGFLARTETPELDGKDHLLHLNSSYLTRTWRTEWNYREVGEAFNPEMGFLPREGYRMYDGLLLRFYRPESIPWLREIRPHIHYTRFEDINSGFRETEKTHVDIHFESDGGGLFSPAFNYVSEGLEESFEIAEGVVLQPGTYSGWEGAWRINSNQSAPLSIQTDVDFGNFLSGSRRGITTTLTARRGGALSTSLRFSYMDVDLPEGEFITRLAGFRAGYFFTPRLYLRSLVQYSDQADTWSANVRLGWLNTAGTGLFLVYNDTQGFGTLDGPLGRSFIIKFTRLVQVAGG
jgi:hypothetical protein